jgi:hypothetical protein
VQRDVTIGKCDDAVYNPINQYDIEAINRAATSGRYNLHNIVGTSPDAIVGIVGINKRW